MSEIKAEAALELKIKTSLNEDIRLLKGKFKDLKDAYDKVKLFIKKSYVLESLDDHILQYEDDENDFVTIANHLDLDDAIDQANQRKKSVKIFVKKHNKKNDDNNNVKPKNEAVNDDAKEDENGLTGNLCDDINDKEFKKDLISFLQTVLLLYKENDNGLDLLACIATGLSQYEKIGEHKQIKLLLIQIQLILPQIEVFIKPFLMKMDGKKVEEMVNKFIENKKNGKINCGLFDGGCMPFMTLLTGMCDNDNTNNCPRNHGLNGFVADKDSFHCDGCKVKSDKGAFMYGCRVCNYDLCVKCYFKVVPNCRGKHGLFYFKTPTTQFTCDGCNQKMLKTNIPMYGCRKCGYDLCLNCYDGNAGSQSFPTPFGNFGQFAHGFGHHGWHSRHHGHHGNGPHGFGHHGFGHGRGFGHGHGRRHGKRHGGCKRNYWRNNNNNNNNDNSNEKDIDDKKTPYIVNMAENPMPIVAESIVDPNQGIIKIWKMKNEGSQSLPANLLVKYSGRRNNPMVSTEQFYVGNKKEIKTGEEFTVTVCIKTPQYFGRFSSNWRLCTPDGKKFGQKLPFYLILSPPNNNNNNKKAAKINDEEKEEPKQEQRANSDSDSIEKVVDIIVNEEPKQNVPDVKPEAEPKQEEQEEEEKPKLDADKKEDIEINNEAVNESDMEVNDSDSEMEDEIIIENEKAVIKEEDIIIENDNIAPQNDKGPQIEKVYKYEKEFQQLKAMGFKEDKFLKAVLDANQGRLDDVMTVLLN